MIISTVLEYIFNIEISLIGTLAGPYETYCIKKDEMDLTQLKISVTSLSSVRC